MSKTKSRVVLGTHFWSGIYSWFARGGVVSGPPVIMSCFREMFQRDAERTILRLLNEVLPYSLFFDEIYLPPTEDMGLSEGLKRDMVQCLGVRVSSRKELEELAETGRERAEHHLSVITSRSDARDLVSELYRIAGPFAGDLPDLHPVLHSMDVAVYLSQTLNAKLNCRPAELGILRIVAEGSLQPSADKRLEVVQKVFRVHDLPILTLDAFKNEKGVVDLDQMFSSMASLRKSNYIANFRRKVSEITKVPKGDIEQVIAQDIVHDLRTTLEEVVSSPSEIRKRLAQAILTDIIGIVVPFPTATPVEGVSIALNKKKSASLEWRLFVFQYGDVVSGKIEVQQPLKL